MKIKNLLLGLVVAVLGIVVIIKPQFLLYAAVLFIGAFAVISGIINLIELKKISENPAYKKTVIIKSLISIIVGLIAIISPLLLLNTVGAIWKIMAYVLAVYLVVYSITGFIAVSILSAENSEILKKRKTTESFICLLIAVLLFVIPLPALIDTVLRIIGCVIAVPGLTVFIFEISRLVRDKKAEKNVIEVEAEVRDDDSGETSQETENL